MLIARFCYMQPQHFGFNQAEINFVEQPSKEGVAFWCGIYYAYIKNRNKMQYPNTKYIMDKWLIVFPL